MQPHTQSSRRWAHRRRLDGSSEARRILAMRCGCSTESALFRRLKIPKAKRCGCPSPTLQPRITHTGSRCLAGSVRSGLRTKLPLGGVRSDPESFNRECRKRGYSCGKRGPLPRCAEERNGSVIIDAGFLILHPAWMARRMRDGNDGGRLGRRGCRPRQDGRLRLSYASRDRRLK
jgi:hypothetical protein